MHVAIIMDGNGRWAMKRHLPRSAGHRAGAKAVNAIVEEAARRGVRILSLYAFSAANWGRPKEEVSALFTLLRRHLLTQTRRCLEQSIRINIIGRRDRLSDDLLRVIERSERLTAHCTRMQLRIAVDYSAQHSLFEAGRRMRLEPEADAARFAEHLAAVDHCAAADHCAAGAVPVDLLIRTGGEQRLSDFLLWECAYAELYFVDCCWPDFDEQAFAAALAEYSRRERRFGLLAPPLARAGLG
jgi:undecaprenyl diphosphate synthase